MDVGGEEQKRLSAVVIEWLDREIKLGRRSHPQGCLVIIVPVAHQL